jgi:RNA polymerase sigma factor (sigma-70 family)
MTESLPVEYTRPGVDDGVEVDIAALVVAAGRGDQNAWDVLVARFTRLLWSIARGYRLDDATAADAVQTTWLRLVDNLDKISEPEAIGGWLATRMRRECLHVLRRSAREIPSTTNGWLDEEPARLRELDARLLDDERDRALWRAMGMLKERCQRLLRVLMAAPAPSYDEVSAALGMPIGSIGPTRQRCLRHLRRLATADPVLADSGTGHDQR